MFAEKTKSPEGQPGRAAFERYAARDTGAQPAAAMKSAIVKRSVELHGHKTSVSLEDEFWHALRAIATDMKLHLPVLLQKIDGERGGANLSSAIRVYVLAHYRDRVSPRTEDPAEEPAALKEPLRS